MDLETLGDEATYIIKSASWFPYRTGWLKYHCVKNRLLNPTTYQIEFDNDIAMMKPTKKGYKRNPAPYITYLEEGTRPHNIPNAFGKGQEFGISGRFDGKFHPGSTKHKGFISNKSVQAVIQYICSKYNGVVR